MECRSCGAELRFAKVEGGAIYMKCCNNYCNGYNKLIKADQPKAEKEAVNNGK